jgi:hypothetical protein
LAHLRDTVGYDRQQPVLFVVQVRPMLLLEDSREAGDESERRWSSHYAPVGKTTEISDLLYRPGSDDYIPLGKRWGSFQPSL